MRVINISHADFANYSYENAMALKSVGISADAFVLTPHPFGYKHQAIRTSLRDIRIQIRRADVIQVMHSCGTMWDMVKNVGNKRIIVWHTGTRYRTNPIKHNERWNNVVERSMIALGEFMTLGARNPKYFGITINTNDYTPTYNVGKVLRIGHYPSNKIVKGTDNILRVIKHLKNKHGRQFTWNYSNTKVNHVNQIKRMVNCDAYVEMCALSQNGNPYGSYGTTALEAAALGKIVLTNNLWGDVYEKEYGSIGLKIANSESQLISELERLVGLSSKEIIDEKMKAREWVENKHGRFPQGERLKQILLEYA